MTINLINPGCFLSHETSAMVTRMRTAVFPNKHGGGDEDGRRGGGQQKAAAASLEPGLKARTQRLSVPVHSRAKLG